MREAVCDAALSAEELDALLEERGELVGFCSSGGLSQHTAFFFVPPPPSFSPASYNRALFPA